MRTRFFRHEAGNDFIVGRPFFLSLEAALASFLWLIDNRESASLRKEGRRGAMAEARGPTHLLEVCNQKFAEFLYNAEYKCLMWLREIEEEALKMFESNFTTEPELMPKTPSQRKHRKKKRSSSFKDENKELTRKRLSKRRSGIKTASFQRPFQNKEGLGNFDMGIMDSISHCMTSSVKEASDVQCDISPEGRTLDTNCGKNTEIKGKEHERMTEKTEKEGDASRLRNTPSPKAFLKGKPSCRVEEIPAQGLINSLLPAGELSQEVKDSPGTPANSQSGHHPPNRVHKIRRVSLVEKYSLTNKRKSTIRKSLSRAMAKKKSAQDTSSTCSHASSHSSLEVFMDGETSQHRPLLTQNAESGETPNTLQKMPCSLDTPSPIASCVVQSSPKHDMQQEVCSKEKLETEIMDFQVSGSEDSAHNNCIHTQLQNSQKQSYKHKLDQPPVQSIQDEKFSSHKTASSPANKIIRPIKNFFQSMQKNNLLKPSGSPGKNSVKHSTPIRPATKEKQRQRLESLRKKQEAEQQRKQKVEEEKRRRLEEIKLKREERLKKALQARERVEQMEEEKKKRIGQKLSQLEEKNEKVREEKAAEEKNRKKKSVKKMGEAEARKQKLLQEEEPKVQEQPEKWKTVGEIRKMLEHNKVKQEKGHRGQEEKEKLVKPLDLAVVTEEEENFKEEQNPTPVAHQEKKTTHLEAVPAAYKWLSITAQKSPIGNSNKVKPQEVKDMASLTINPNDYGMDLNSDDSTDDENEPRKPIPMWASGLQLNEAVTYQYYNPPDITRLFGLILSPKLEDIFYKSKPRYFKRTSSAVWQSPPLLGTKPALRTSNSLKKY